MKIKALKILKIINLITILLLALLGIYTITLISYLLENFSVIIFYLPIIIIPIYGFPFATLINATLTAIILLSIFLGLKYCSAEIQKRKVFIGEIIPVIYLIATIISILIPQEQPIPLDIRIVPALVIWAPIYEEIFFRLILILLPVAIKTNNFRIFFEKKDSIERFDLIIISLSSLIFGLYHYSAGLGGILAATIAGLFLGYICVRYGLIFSILTHFMLNLLTGSYIVAFSYGHIYVLYFNLATMTLLIAMGIPNLILLCFYILKQKHTFFGSKSV